jgi:hypothetical protein
MARISAMHKWWLKQPKLWRAYESLEKEFALASLPRMRTLERVAEAYGSCLRISFEPARGEALPHRSIPKIARAPK